MSDISKPQLMHFYDEESAELAVAIVKYAMERTLKQLENDLVRMITSFTKTAGEIFPQDLLEHTDDNLLE